VELLLEELESVEYDEELTNFYLKLHNETDDHVASAELLQSDYMITTDNEIVKNYQKHIEFFEKIKIYNPLLFLTEVL
jgi:translation initiation factor 2 beta subunit (eIF-2beta)/eIF-5